MECEEHLQYACYTVLDGAVDTAAAGGLYIVGRVQMVDLRGTRLGQKRSHLRIVERSPIMHGPSHVLSHGPKHATPRGPGQVLFS
jgi:hypothetical protein